MFSITTEGNYSYVFTPYNPQFVSKIKSIGGATWVSDQKAWRIPSDQVDIAREIMRKVYGRDDAAVDASRYINVLLTCSEIIEAEKEPVIVYGHTLASARARDGGARVGEGVALLEGTIESGGSARYWKSIVNAGCVFRITGVLKQLFYDEKLPNGCTAEIIEPDKTSRRQVLLNEQKELKTRLAEIEKELESL